MDAFIVWESRPVPVALDFTIPHLLRTPAEYQSAVGEIDQLLDAEVEAGTMAWERLRFLAVLVQAYEEETSPVEERLANCTPQSAVEFMLQQRGMTRAELVPLFGSKSRVSEFFNGQRPLSKAQIVALRSHLGIPADLLLSV